MISVSLPGKIHLIGEHSVVYGYPAILAPINLFLHTKISNPIKSDSKSNKKQISGIVQYDNAIKNLQETLEKKIIEKFKVKIPSYKIEFDKSKIPVGSGLGTSASLSAAFTICLLKFLEVKHTQKDVFEIALEGEKIFHGNPSGGDLAAVLNKGLILFQKDSDKKIKITPLHFKLSAEIKNLLLIDSGKPEEQTSQMVQIVNTKFKKSKIKFTKFFESQENLTMQMIESLKNKDSKMFFEIIKKAQQNLEQMGVAGKNAKAIIRKIEGLGGAGKITGAGGIKKGSGMILAFHKDQNELIKFAKKSKLDYYSITI